MAAHLLLLLLLLLLQQQQTLCYKAFPSLPPSLPPQVAAILLLLLLLFSSGDAAGGLATLLVLCALSTFPKNSTVHSYTGKTIQLTGNALISATDMPLKNTDGPFVLKSSAAVLSMPGLGPDPRCVCTVVLMTSIG